MEAILEISELSFDEEFMDDEEIQDRLWFTTIAIAGQLGIDISID